MNGARAGVTVHSKRLLIVEDDPDLAAVMADVLETAGYRTDLARNGQEALWHLRHQAVPSLVLLDLWMPIMNGFEFRARQLEDPALATIPVLVISAELDLQKAGALEATVYLRKPVRLVDLVAVVRRLCGNPYEETDQRT